MPKRLLLVEDDLFSSRLIASYFESRGYIVECVFDSGAAIRSSVCTPPDCIVLDINLPTMSGIKLFSELRRLHTCPVVFYTSEAKASVELDVLTMGGDDFITKNRGVPILFNRVERLLVAKVERNSETSKVVTVNGLQVNLSLNECSFQGKTIRIQLQEAQMLYYILMNEGQAVNRDELSFVTKGYSYDGWTRSIDLALSRLRKKLLQIGVDKECIKTIRGKGYCFRSDRLSSAACSN
ncbi:response regulator [Agarivorans sp. B2Z047]|uniref:response regulator transcription factor n=1 Tax=Agarivorans sp. B2Z047 TaxID=2652721 RepID=UPI00128B7A20|nr:response regulator transcription factor [Agarivorans sp. B2Z047]MPW30805.1 response regulator [Agarivorans sp. B2Z047]UQN40965.1 response regulator transcription factor [Agarivorans sp. B2Z047]